MEAPKCVQEQEKRLHDALSADDKATISAKALADALGAGFTRQSIINAAFENLLPFGFGHRRDLKSDRHVAIPKAAVWNWFQKQKG